MGEKDKTNTKFIEQLKTIEHKLRKLGLMSVQKRIAFAVLSFSVFSIAFFPLHRWVDPAAGSFVMLPVALTAWLFGIWGGIVVGLLSFPLVTILLNLAEHAGWNVLIQHGGGPGMIALLLVAIVIGRMRDLGVRVREELARRNQAEEEVKKSHRFTRTIFDTIPDAVITTDLNFDVVACNQSVKQILGYEPEELIGKHYSLFVSEEMFEDPNQKGREEELFRKGYIHHEEFYFKKKNGEKFPASFSTALIKDEEGNPIGLVGTIHDITERKQAEAAARKRLEDLEEFHKATVGRELKMIELKKKIEQLEQQLVKGMRSSISNSKER